MLDNLVVQFKKEAEEKLRNITTCSQTERQIFMKLSKL